MASPSVDECRRLAFVRYLCRLGSEESRLPAALRGASLLRLHDAVELFLCVACDHAGAKLKERTDFEGYYQALSNATPPVHLKRWQRMRRLNDARVSLKHHGNLPADDTVEELASSAILFLDDNCQAVFGVSLATISMSSLIQNERVRRGVESAEALLAENEAARAADEMALAFEAMVLELERDDEERGGGPFSEPFSHLIHMPPRTGARDVDNYFRALSDSMSAIRESLRFLAWGMDISRYHHYRRLAPRVGRCLDGHCEVYCVKKEISNTDVRFCLDFVIDSMLQVQRLLVVPSDDNTQPPKTTHDPA